MSRVVDGYRVMTQARRTVGVIMGESDQTFVVRFGRWRKRYCALPKRCAWVNGLERTVVMVVDETQLTRSPELAADGSVDELLVEEFCGVHVI